VVHNSVWRNVTGKLPPRQRALANRHVNDNKTKLKNPELTHPKEDIK
jgi:hypothetical protein